MTNNSKDNQFCMSFSSKLIIDNLVLPMEKEPNICIRIMSPNENELHVDTQEEIEFVCFDGKDENFYISFYESHTLIFILNMEFMFIDDRARKSFVSSDTYHNVVYNGTLNDKTKEEILLLLFDFLKVLNGAKTLKVEEIFISQTGFQYPLYNYLVYITNDSGIKSEKRFDNIFFYIN